MYLITGLVGLVALAAPFVLGYTDNTAALWTTLGAGAVLVVTAILEGVARDEDNWEYWVVAILGLGAIVAPFVLDFTATTEALWTTIGIGVVAVIAAGLRLFSKQIL
jgi:hypothetical protein